MNLTLASVVAIPLLALSSVSFADEAPAPVTAEPMMLSAAEMDGITAGDPYEVTINSTGLLSIGNIQGKGGSNYVYYPVIVYKAPVLLEPS
ncbi:MAG: hypothetical protein JWM42_4160 [Burkholderia sp.]|jgi:hypothetical protein|nr:hypothetical protein [Burkholderia sp.]